MIKKYLNKKSYNYYTTVSSTDGFIKILCLICVFLMPNSRIEFQWLSGILLNSL